MNAKTFRILSALIWASIFTVGCYAAESKAVTEENSDRSIAPTNNSASVAPINFGDAGLVFIPKSQYLMDDKNAMQIKPMREAFLEYAKFDSLVNVGVFAQSPVLYGKKNIFLVLEQEDISESASQKAALLLTAASLGVVPSVSSKKTGLLLSVSCPDNFKFSKNYEYARAETASLFLFDRNHHAGLAFYNQSVKDFFHHLNADSTARRHCQQSLLASRELPTPLSVPSGQEEQWGLYINQGPDFYRAAREQEHINQILKIVGQAVKQPVAQVITSETRKRTLWMNYNTKKNVDASDAAQVVGMMGTLGLVPIPSKKRSTQVELQAVCDGKISEPYVHKGEVQETMALYIDANRSLNQLLRNASSAFFNKLSTDPMLKQSCGL